MDLKQKQDFHWKQALAKKAELREKRLEEMPNVCRGTYESAMQGKSRKTAVKAFCQECMGWESYQIEIRGCTAQACPLYEYRPYK